MPARDDATDPHRGRSRFHGVVWESAAGRWAARLYEPGRRVTRIGHFAREEDAALARERVALHVLGPAARRNFPDRRLKPASIEEIRASLRQARKLSTTSRWIGVYLVPETARRRIVGRPWLVMVRVRSRPVNMGCWATGREAALAHDRATLFYRGDHEPMNFPDEARRLGPADVRTLRALCERARKAATTSRYRGVSWAANCGRWRAVITSADEKIHIGLYDDELEAARAYDAKANVLHGRRAKLNHSTGSFGCPRSPKCQPSGWHEENFPSEP